MCDVLLDEEHTDAACSRVRQRREQPLNDEGRKTERQLVDDKQVRLGSKRACHRQDLLFAPREQPCASAEQRLELREQFESDAGLAPTEIEVVGCRQGHEHRLLLGYIAEATTSAA